VGLKKGSKFVNLRGGELAFGDGNEDPIALLKEEEDVSAFREFYVRAPGSRAL
jgi:hypothetical protein